MLHPIFSMIYWNTDWIYVGSSHSPSCFLKSPLYFPTLCCSLCNFFSSIFQFINLPLQLRLIYHLYHLLILMSIITFFDLKYSPCIQRFCIHRSTNHGLKILKKKINKFQKAPKSKTYIFCMPATIYIVFTLY